MWILPCFSRESMYSFMKIGRMPENFSYKMLLGTEPLFFLTNLKISLHCVSNSLAPT